MVKGAAQPQQVFSRIAPKAEVVAKASAIGTVVSLSGE
jgi:hypothetical protein